MARMQVSKATKPAWPQSTFWLFLKCCQDGTIKGEAPWLLSLFSLLAGMSHNDREPRKAPSMSQHTLPSATPSGLPCWATLSLQVAGGTAPPGLGETT